MTRNDGLQGSLRSTLETARAAALAAGDLILDSGIRSEAEAKGEGDYVTEVDLAAEDIISEVLRSAFPDIPILAEEAGGTASDLYWCVDPLDGTTNFIHGFPAVGVSIALIENGRPVLGVVHAPFLGQTYAAERGAGAFLMDSDGEHRLSVSARPPERAVLATGFPFRRKERIPRHLEVVRRCLESFEDLRRPGAASLDLAWVASGVFEGFFELGLSSWDVAAGALLVEEAGGVVSDWSGGPDYLSGDILAASPAVHERLVEITTSTQPG